MGTDHSAWRYCLGACRVLHGISKIVDTKLTNAGMVSPATVAANTESIEDLEKQAEKLDNKIERIIDILLEE